MRLFFFLFLVIFFQISCFWTETSENEHKSESQIKSKIDSRDSQNKQEYEFGSTNLSEFKQSTSKLNFYLDYLTWKEVLDPTDLETFKMIVDGIESNTLKIKGDRKIGLTYNILKLNLVHKLNIIDNGFTLNTNQFSDSEYDRFVLNQVDTIKFSKHKPISHGWYKSDAYVDAVIIRNIKRQSIDTVPIPSKLMNRTGQILYNPMYRNLPYDKEFFEKVLNDNISAWNGVKILNRSNTAFVPFCLDIMKNNEIDSYTGKQLLTIGKHLAYKIGYQKEDDIQFVLDYIEKVRDDDSFDKTFKKELALVEHVLTNKSYVECRKGLGFQVPTFEDYRRKWEAKQK